MDISAIKPGGDIRRLVVLSPIATLGIALAVADPYVAAAAPAADADESRRIGLEQIEQSLDAHGGLGPIEESGGIEVSLDGTFDLTTRLQGHSPTEPSETPIHERISVDIDGRRVAYDLHWYNYVHSEQRLREVYDAQGRVLFVDVANENGGWMPVALVDDARQRYERLVPQLLLRDAQSRDVTVTSHGRRSLRNEPADVVSYRTTAGDVITIYIDPDTALVRAARTPIAMPLLGDSTMTWVWTGYRMQHGLQLPTELTVYLNEDVMKRVDVTTRPGINATAFGAPEGIVVSDPPEPVAREARVPAGQQPPDVRELAPQVYGVADLRPGFFVLFVEFDEYVVAIDAPTGWYEMQQLPPMNWSLGDTTDSLARKFLKAIEQTVPDKPVRYLVLTHHHSDHIGGLRPFLAEGATIVASQPAALMAQQAASADYTLEGDPGPALSEPIAIEIVETERTITDGSMEMRLISLSDDNPHAKDYLVVYLPGEKILYMSAFIYPLPESVFPPKESIPAMTWFVEWLDQSGLDIDRQYNIHGMREVQGWHLDHARRLSRTKPTD